MNRHSHAPSRLLLWLAAAALPATLPAAEDSIPFVIPGSATPAEGSVVDLAWMNAKPAGAQGFVRANGGKFLDGSGQRIRFLATNMTFSSCFPEHEMADKLAARLASLGINCIRFHHADNAVAPRGIWKAGTPKKNEFDPDQLDRLDYFIAALKRHGIYSNINLHVSRSYWEGEDFPDGLTSDRERQEQLPKYGKGLDKINELMIRMQRDYARALLTHVNPYTKTSYAKEPCVAIVEINNENTLLQLKVGALPEYYRADILAKWNAWLKGRYGSTEKLAAAWGGAEELGDDILPSRMTTQGGNYLAVAKGDEGETRVTLLKAPEASWHAQLHWTGLTLEEKGLYTLEFSARSELPRRVPVSTRLGKEDWHNCGLSEDAELGPDWKTFTYTFRAERVEPGALRFDMVVGGGPLGDFRFKDLTLRRGGSLGMQPGESLEARNIALPVRSKYSARWLDWTRFLAETERAYTDGMREFLKKDLGVEASIIDTQASYGGIVGTYRESFNDFIDMHAYWQHPHFPGRPWDSKNWNIRNTPMVDDADGGNFARLATYRMSGKAYTVSEYDHPAPSHYSAELFPMMASFAALQDWDGLFQFDWGGTEPDTGRITGYFALQQHPAKLAFLPAAALMFRRGDVQPAVAMARLAIPAKQAVELTAENVSMQDAWKNAGATTANLVTHRFEICFTDGEEVKLDLDKDAKSPVTWEPAAGIYTVDAPAAKVVVGRCTGRVTKLTGVQLDVKSNQRNFAAITLNAADGEPLAKSRRLLLTAVGKVENTDMGWNEDFSSVSNQWGKAPTLCESVAATVTLETGSAAAKVHALDGAGARIAEVPSTQSGGKLRFEIGPSCKTLWYEIAAE